MRYIISACLAIAVVLVAFRSEQDFTISGIVRDDGGMPLAGITIQEKQHHKKVLTTTDGRFTISVSGEHATLIFSGAGYETQELMITDYG